MSFIARNLVLSPIFLIHIQTTSHDKIMSLEFKGFIVVKKDYEKKYKRKLFFTVKNLDFRRRYIFFNNGNKILN